MIAFLRRVLAERVALYDRNVTFIQRELHEVSQPVEGFFICRKDKLRQTKGRFHDESVGLTDLNVFGC